MQRLFVQQNIVSTLLGGVANKTDKNGVIISSSLADKISESIKESYLKFLWIKQMNI